MSGAVQDSSETGVDEQFDRYQERLRRTVRLRLDRRLSGIVDSTTVLEMVRQLAIERRGEIASRGGSDLFLWFRQLTGEALSRLHQERLGTDIRGDVSLYRGALPEATSMSLAAHLLGRGGGEDDMAAARAEQKLLLQEALNTMDPVDREVLTLRHCEQLSNDETATVLSISRSVASEAYIRALKRISLILASLPGFKGKKS